MAKRETKKQREEREQNEAYLENYKQLAERLKLLSKFNVRQFMGTRQEGDPRVNYLAGLEGFKNLANAQLSGIIRILTMMLGDRKQEFLKIMEEDLVAHVKSMEEDLGIIGWNKDGSPKLDLQAHLQKTKGWPP